MIKVSMATNAIRSCYRRFGMGPPTLFLASALLLVTGPGQAFARSERTVPTPSTVSTELQALLRMGDAPGAPWSLPTSNKGWFLMRGTAAEQHAVTTKLLTRFGVTLTSRTIGGVTCFVLTPMRVAAADRKKLLIHVHGGAYVMNAGEIGTDEGIMMASAMHIPVVSIDYRMPPDHPFPAAIDDVTAVWRTLTKEHRPRDMALFGSSTGGALILSAVQNARAEALALPAAIIAGTPWSDLSKTGDSYFVNELTAVPYYDGFLSETAKLYADGLDLKDPRVSPLYGSFTRFPPTMLISGTRDIFLSNTVRVQRKLLDAGVPNELVVYEGQMHVAYLAPDIPESSQAFGDMVRFLRRHLTDR